MSVDISLESDVPAGLRIWVDRFQIFAINAGTLESQGIEAVEHDGTITGDGTDANPLSIQDAVDSLQDAIDDKQGKLTAGHNITIDANNVISSTGGGSDIPVEGEVGQVLTKTQDGFDWKDTTVPKGSFTIVSANVHPAYQSYIDVPSMPLKYNISRGLFVLSGAFNVKSTFTATRQPDDDPNVSRDWVELIYWDLPQSIDTSLIERSLLLGFSSSDPVKMRAFRLWIKSNETQRLALGITLGNVEVNWYNIQDIIKIF